MSVFLITATTWHVFCNNVGLVKTGTIWCPFSLSLQLHDLYSAIMSGLSKRAPFDVRFPFHYNYGGTLKTHIRPELACQNGHHWCPFYFHYNYGGTVFLNNYMYSAIMSGLSKRAPFDVRFPFHYNYGGTLKTHIRPELACQNGHHTWCPFYLSLQLRRYIKNNIWLVKTAPYDVRFTFHYNYGIKNKYPNWLVKTGTIWCPFSLSLQLHVFCNNVGLVKTGTIWCPFSFSLQLRRYIKNTY